VLNDETANEFLAARAKRAWAYPAGDKKGRPQAAFSIT
jgi:hypothetical protein